MVTWSTKANQQQPNVSKNILHLHVFHRSSDELCFPKWWCTKHSAEPYKRPVEREKLIIIPASSAFVFIWKFPWWPWNIGNENGWRRRALYVDYNWCLCSINSFVSIDWSGSSTKTRKKKSVPFCIRSIPAVTLASVHLIRADPVKRAQFSFSISFHRLDATS